MFNSPVFLIIIFVWLLILSYLFYSLGKHYNRLSAGISKSSLKEILEKILSTTKINEEQIAKLEKLLLKLKEDNSFHIQKIGLLRFNPFSDTGGDQSFVLAVLDEHNNGIVLSSLYARTGTRWYAKSVKNGKGTEHELSGEEEKTIKQAKFYN